MRVVVADALAYPVRELQEAEYFKKKVPRRGTQARMCDMFACSIFCATCAPMRA